MGLLNFIRPASLTFVGKEHIVGDVYSYSFQSDSDVAWRAGQHGLLELKLPSGKTARRMFSLSSAPSEQKITVTTHWRGNQASDYKKALWALESGDTAKMRGPVGSMYIRDNSAQNVLIAGGIGITPFRSILQEAAICGHDLRGALLYANRDASSVAFKAELDELATQLPHVTIDYITSPQAITEHTISQASGGGGDAMYYLSGPPKMIRDSKKLLKSMGVPTRNIKSDPFMGYK